MFLGRKNKYIKYIDLNFVFIIIFFIIYAMFSLYDGHEKTEFNMQNLFAAPALYITGKWLGEKSKSEIYLVRAIWITGLALASITLIAVINNIVQHGFTGGVRNLVVSDAEQETSATVLAGLLIIIVSYAGVIFSISTALKNTDKALISIFFILSLISAARLGSRTILLLGIVSILQGIYINRKKYNFFHLSFIIFAIVISSIASIEYMSNALDIFSYYEDRLEDEGTGIGSAGGRSERWINSISLLINNPMGWGINLNGYSHNLWLDAARNGGIISMLFLIILSHRAIKSIIKTISISSNDMAFKTLVSCLSISYLLLFLVEPIFDGFVYVFASFCCFWGITQGYSLANNFRKIT